MAIDDVHSYQTPQGIVSGIQWIPAEATSVVPQGAIPADEVGDQIPSAALHAC